MIQISPTYAHDYILQVLDELENSENDSMLSEAEGIDTLKLTEGYLAEAVIKAHKDAPSLVVDGVVGKEDEDYEVEWSEKVADLKMLKDTIKVVSVKVDGSPVVTEYFPEDSAIGRMQDNQYVRGTYDDPKLIVKKVWEHDRKPEFYYYSAKESKPTMNVEYIPYPDSSLSTVSISDKLEYAVLNLVASMVLDALSLHDKATIYKNKYTEYISASR